MAAGSERPPALERFRGYLLCSTDLERRKTAVRRASRGMRKCHEMIMRYDERRLEDGWEEVGEIAEGLSDLSASVVASHYLFGVPWCEVAAESGMSLDKAKKAAYRALRWLDSHGGTVAGG